MDQICDKCKHYRASLVLAGPENEVSQGMCWEMPGDPVKTCHSEHCGWWEARGWIKKSEGNLIRKGSW